MSDYNLGTARGKIVLDADTGGAKVANDALDQVGQSADNASQKLENTLKRTQAVQQGLRIVGTGLLIAGGAIVAGFTAAVNTAADFEHEMSAIQAVSGATADEMDLITAAALRIGKNTVFSASEAGQAIEELVKAGISVEDVLNGAADATVALAAAGGVDLPTAATIAANAMNQFGLAAEDLVHVTDLVAGAANASAIDMHDFQLSLSQVGAVAKLSGASFDDTATAIALMGNAGIRGSDAGTSLKQVFLNLIPVTDKQKELMRELGLLTEDGSNAFYDAAGNLKSMAEISQVLQDATAGLSEEQKNYTLGVLFGSDAIRGAAILANEGAAGFEAMAESMSKISAADVAATRMDNLKGSIEQLRGSAETLAIEIGNVLLPVVTDIVDAFAGVIDRLIEVNPNILAMGAGIGLAAGVGLVFLGVAGQIASSLLVMHELLLRVASSYGLATVAQLRMAAAAKVAAAAQAVFNAVMNVNPIIRIIAVVLALVAAIITLAGGWDEVIAAFQPVLASLQAALMPLLPIFQELGKTIADVFGQALQALLPILQVLIDAVFPIIIDLISALAPVIGAIAQILAAVLGPILKVVGKLFEALAPILITVLDALAPLIDLLVQILVPVLDAVVWVLERLGEGLQWVADQISAFFAESADGTSAAGDAWQAFVDFLTTIWNNWVSQFNAIVGAITGFFGMLYDAGVAAWTGIMAVVTPVVEWFQTYVGPLIEAVVNLIVALFNFALNNVIFIWNAIQAGVAAVVDWFNTYVAPIIAAVVAAVVGFFTMLWNSVVTIWNNIRSAITTVASAIQSFLVSIFSPIVAWFHSWFDPIVGAVKGPLDQVFSFISDLKTKVINFFANAGQWLLDAGKNIIGGLIKGIEGALGGLTSLLNNITSMIPKNKGPEEKDKVLLYENGSLIMRGLMAGIQSEVGNLLGMLGGLNVSIPAALDAGLAYQTGSSESNKIVNWTYNAAPGSGQLSGEDEFKRAVKVSKVVVPGWAG